MNLNTRFAALLVLTAAVAAQGAPTPRSPQPAPAAPVARTAAPATAGSPLYFGFRDGGHLLQIEVDGDTAKGSSDGKPLPAARVKKVGARVNVYDDDGIALAQITLWAGGGSLQLCNDRTRVALGLRLGVADNQLATSLGLESRAVRRILSVTPGLPAAKAGLQAGDLVLDLDGEKPVTEDRLRAVLQRKKPGEDLHVSIHRAGRLLPINVVLEPRQALPLTGVLGATAAPTPLPRYLAGLRAIDNDADATELANQMPNRSDAPQPPLVQVQGDKMLLMPERAGKPGKPVAPASDPLQELQSVKQRLEAMERMLQRLVDAKEAKERSEDGDAGKGKPKDKPVKGNR
jgi:membrane-associated protease RseP (regulator of RpoE activity)